MKKKKSGLGSAIGTGVMLVVIVGIIMGVAKVNNITSIPGAYEFFKGYSDKIWSCTNDGKAQWNCDTAGGGAAAGGTTKPAQQAPKGTAASVPTTELVAGLNNLTVAAGSSAGYERSQWKHWVGSPCNTRETVLKTQGTNVKTDPSDCSIQSGTWVDPYTGDTITEANSLDIDHVIPLGYASAHGGLSWSSAKKQQFANDTSQLMAVSASANRSKSDKGPSQYMPRDEFACSYSKVWVATAAKYGVSITADDKKALATGLGKCA